MSTVGGPWAAWSSASTPVRALLVSRLVNRAGGLSLIFLGVFVTTRLGASTQTAGALLTLWGVLTIPSRLLGGGLLRHLGAQGTLLVGLAGCVAGQVILAVAPSVPVAAVGCAVFGLAFEVVEPPSQLLVSNAGTEQTRPGLLGLFFASSTVAAVIAGALGAVLAGVDLRVMFAVDAISCLVCGWIIWRYVPDALDDRDHGGAWPWRDRAWQVLFLVGAVFATAMMMYVFGQPLLVAHRHVGLWVIGVASMAGAAAGVAVQPLLHLRLLTRRNNRLGVALSFLGLAAGAGLLGAAHTPAVFIASEMLFASAEVLAMSFLYAQVAQIAAPPSRGRYLAAFGLTWGLANTIAPLVVGALVYNPLTWTAVTIAMTATAATTVLITNRLPEPETPMAE